VSSALKLQPRHVPIGQTNCVIVVRGHRAFISGDFPLQIVRKATSYYVDGFMFSPAYKRKVWDGKKHLFDQVHSSMPAGLAPLVLEELRLYDPKGNIQLIDDNETHRPAIGNKGFELQGIKFGQGVFDYQLEAAKALVAGRKGILRIATNGGKCLHPNTPVLLYDGRVIRAAQVRVGDLLMGPDSEPRRVTSTCDGAAQMYRVTPKRAGEPFECNSVHVLTIFDPKAEAVVDVSLDEFLSWTKDRRRLSRLVRAGVEFKAPEDPVPVDPWLLGIWYADGRKDLGVIEITKPDKEIQDAIAQVALSAGQSSHVRRPEDRCSSTFITENTAGDPHSLLNKLRTIYGSGERLPDRYLRGTRQEREAFLAGFIDGDGYSDGCNIELVLKQRAWVDDLAFLARSLGFGASIRAKKVCLAWWSKPRTYWKLVLIGDTKVLPLRLKRKHARPKRQWQHVGFRVEPVGFGPYAGFTLEGDGRFLLGDFTVTHNTEVAIAVTKHLALPTLFLVDRMTLVYQTVARFALRLGIREQDIGFIADSEYRLGAWITVATPASLANRLKLPEVEAMLPRWQLVWSDEAHHAASDTHYDVLSQIPAYYRFGMSGTPLDRSDGADLRLLAQTGPVLYEVSNKLLVDRGISVPPYVEMLKVHAPIIPSGLSFREVEKLGIVENPHLNTKAATKAIQHARKGDQVLMLVDKTKQGAALAALLKKYSDKPWAYLTGTDRGRTRLEVLDQFAKNKISILVATPILDEGVDVPNIDVLILCAGGKAKIRLLQRVGRGLRANKGKDRLLVYDFANFSHKWLLRHSLERLKTYKAEACFVISVGI